MASYRDTHVGLDPWPNERPRYVVVRNTPDGIYAEGMYETMGVDGIPTRKMVRLVRLAGKNGYSQLPDVLIDRTGESVNLIAALQELKDIPF